MKVLAKPPILLGLRYELFISMPISIWPGGRPGKGHTPKKSSPQYAEGAFSDSDFDPKSPR